MVEKKKTARAAAAGAKKSSGAKNPDLRKDLRDFASGRPTGWGHEDWLNFLESLRSRGHNVNDRDAIGLALERERLDLALNGVAGVGPQRRKSLVEKYDNVWTLRSADAGEIAKTAGIKRDLAEKIKAEL
ncbi:MAG: helix-hairpin-helix domain-containing protein [Gemmatimonadota bacterium]